MDNLIFTQKLYRQFVGVLGWDESGLYFAVVLYSIFCFRIKFNRVKVRINVLGNTRFEYVVRIMCLHQPHQSV